MTEEEILRRVIMMALLFDDKWRFGDWTKEEMSEFAQQIIIEYQMMRKLYAIKTDNHND